MQDYINSGILEAYVLGCATEEEARQVLYMKEKHAEVREALLELETDMESMAGHMAITPPPYLWNKIEQQIDEITLRQPQQPEIYRDNGNNAKAKSGQQYIDVEAESTHMRVHKVWRWIFAGVFLLGKVFLAFAIYYYIHSIKADQQVKDLERELQELRK